MALRVSLFWALAAALLTSACDRKSDETSAPPRSSSAPVGSTAPGARPSASAAGSTVGPTGAVLPEGPVSPSGSNATPATSASASASQATAAAFCDRVLTAVDIKSVCGSDSSAATPPNVSGAEIPPSFVCSHRFTLGERSLMVTVNGWPDAKAAQRFYDDSKESRSQEPEFKAVSGVGDAARRFVAISLTNDLNHTIELRKGATTVKVITPKVTSNNRDLAPLCTLDQLDALGKLIASRL